jgi:hypothetical protein
VEFVRVIPLVLPARNPPEFVIAMLPADAIKGIASASNARTTTRFIDNSSRNQIETRPQISMDRDQTHLIRETDFPNR